METMTTDLEKIQNWLSSEEKDYKAGVELLRAHISNRVLLNNLNVRENRFNKEKLVHELQKVANLLEVDNMLPHAKDEVPLDVDPNIGRDTSGNLTLKSAKGKDFTVPEGKTAQVDLKLGNSDAPLEDPASTTKVEETPPAIPPGAGMSLADAEKLGVDVTKAYSAKEPMHARSSSVESPVVPQREPLSINDVVGRMNELYNQKAELSNTLADIGTEEVSRAQRQGVVDQIVAIEEKYNRLAEVKKQMELGAYADASSSSGIAQFKPEPKAPDVPVAEMDKSALINKRNNLRSQLTKANKAVAAAPDDVVKQEKAAKVSAELKEIEQILSL